MQSANLNSSEKQNDEELQSVMTYIKLSKINACDKNVKGYTNIFEELTMVDGLVLRGERIVVSQELRETMIAIAHKGH